MSANEKALKEMISASEKKNAARWEQAAGQLEGLDATMISEVLERCPHPGPNPGDSPAMIRLIEMGTAEFFSLRLKGDTMFSDRLLQSLRASVATEALPEAVAPAPFAPAVARGSSASPAPAPGAGLSPGA